MVEVPLKVMHRAHLLGVPADDFEGLRENIAKMVRQSAPITHPAGNRRYEEWVFRIRNDLPVATVTGIHLIKCGTCDDKKRIYVTDVCGYCEGKGCSECGGKGEHRRMIPCPDCAGKTI